MGSLGMSWRPTSLKIGTELLYTSCLGLRNSYPVYNINIKANGAEQSAKFKRDTKEAQPGRQRLGEDMLYGRGQIENVSKPDRDDSRLYYIPDTKYVIFLIPKVIRLWQSVTDEGRGGTLESGLA